MIQPPAMPIDPDAQDRRELRRHRAFATFLLILMGAIVLGCHWLPPGDWADLLQAAAKAGFVGGIADWFAVTALFRHPLGIPIPHTAIVPRQKERLGRALGRFVANHVITRTPYHSYFIIQVSVMSWNRKGVISGPEAI